MDRLSNFFQYTLVPLVPMPLYIYYFIILEECSPCSSFRLQHSPHHLWETSFNHSRKQMAFLSVSFLLPHHLPYYHHLFFFFAMIFNCKRNSDIESNTHLISLLLQPFFIPRKVATHTSFNIFYANCKHIYACMCIYSSLKININRTILYLLLKTCLIHSTA